MGKVFQMFALFFFFTCIYSQETKSKKNINDIYSKLSKGMAPKYKQVKGQLVSVEAKESMDRYTYKFISKDIKQTINYISYPDGKKDVLILDKQKFSIENKIDPLSVTLYEVFVKHKQYLCFIAKAQSASGSGVQVTYFTLVELDLSGKAILFYEFQSRFGNINSLVDYKSNGNLGYFKIINGKKMGQYSLTVNDVKSNRQLYLKWMLLKYELNDKFTILKEMKK